MSESDQNQVKSEREKLAEQFRTQFSFAHDGFSEPIPWTDAVGFSRVRKFANEYASLYKFGIVETELQNVSSRKSLWISVSYGKETMGGISLGSEKHTLSDPIELDFKDEFFCNVTTNKFYYHDKEITPQKILSTIEETHMKPTKKVGGFVLRCRLWFWRKFLPSLIKYFDIFLIGLLWLVSGERIKENIFRRLLGTRSERFKESIPTKEAEFEQSKTMDFFGYKAKRWSVVFYCGLHLLIFFFSFWRGMEYSWLTAIFTSNFLALCYVVISFAFTEALVPQTLKWIISKATPKAFGSISFKRMKVK